MRKLEQGVSERINAICDHAKRLVDGGDVKFAVNKYIEALNLIPNPKMDYKAATFIYTNVGEVYWRACDYKNAGAAFSQATICPGGSDNPIIILRIGQCLLECGDRARSEEYLLKAYLLGGEEIFKNEDDKYYNLVQRKLNNEEQPDDLAEDDFMPDMDDDYILDTSDPSDDYVSDSAEDYIELPVTEEPEQYEDTETRHFSPKRRRWDNEWDDEPEEEVEDDRIQSSYADDIDDDDDEEDEGGLFKPLVNAFKSLFKK